ncbi:unnamed protein product, partial [Rhizoctonia solani]
TSIMMGDTDRILDLADWGSTADGTGICGHSRSAHGISSTKHLTWILEHISDETGEELPVPTQIPVVDPRDGEKIKSQASEITFLRQLVQDCRHEVSRLFSQIERQQALYEGTKVIRNMVPPKHPIIRHGTLRLA